MKITKTIEIRLEEKGNKYIVSDLKTLDMLMGSSGVAGNLHLYGIKKEKKKWIVPKEIVKQRLIDIKERVERAMDKIEVMEQILKK